MFDFQDSREFDLTSWASDFVKDDRARERLLVIQSKTKRPVQFEVTENTHEIVLAWVKIVAPE